MSLGKMALVGVIAFMRISEGLSKTVDIFHPEGKPTRLLERIGVFSAPPNINDDLVVLKGLPIMPNFIYRESSIHVVARGKIDVGMKFESFPIRHLWFFKYRSLNGNRDIVGWRLAIISKPRIGLPMDNASFIFPGNTIYIVNRNICPQLPFGCVRCYLDRPIGGFGGFDCGLGSGSILLQGATDVPNTDSPNSSLRESGNHHPEGPLRHFPLGFQIVFLSFCFFGGLVLCTQGFKRAGYAAEKMEQDGRRYLIPCVLWLGGYLGGAFLAAYSLAIGLRLYG